ncbi:GNAT family N-acetyltransferase [Chloroflexi bacterium TSY]|nr:GNAT family N-acetyltransferase [Chloroflexi bacterium TSY]
MNRNPTPPHHTVTFNGYSITDQSVDMVHNSFTDLVAQRKAVPASIDEMNALLPQRYRMRHYCDGDGPAWLSLIRAAEPFLVIQDNLFQTAFANGPDALPDRMILIESEAGEIIGTTTAWWRDDWRKSGEWGQIHWVAVHPDHQKRGLSKPMMIWGWFRIRFTLLIHRQKSI